MAHNEWCGKPCGDCLSPCKLDESMPCSPDCTELNEDGTRNITVCIENECDALILKAGTCPACNGNDLEYNDSYLEDDSYVYEWTCKKCEATGKEWHNLVFECHNVD